MKITVKNGVIQLPFLMWQDWSVSQSGLVSPDLKTYTPGNIRLLEWKAQYYDRKYESMRDFPLLPKHLEQP
jgi:hypothetical protein